MSTQTTPEAQPAGAPTATYRPFPGVPDELMDTSGAIRPVWRQFIDHFGRLSPDEVARRFARGDQYLHDAGVFFRQYGQSESVERSWPLSHIPVLIDEADWSLIVEGLRQRADLLESIVADLYGPNRLVAEGHLPASLIAGSPEWLRPLVGVVPPSGHFLNFVAFEIGRGPDGTWWVLGDRTQAPSGAGFALENRVATARVFSDLYAEAKVHRLAGFFRDFSEALHGLRGEPDSRVAILTPGPLNDTYFEHAYIARYLGFMLLEGEDLTVEQGRVMVRTVSGLRPVSVLWRRLDASFADPLELDESSRLGTPGLLGAVRKGTVTLVNALGAGVLETRALLAFMPKMSRALRGEPLVLPNIATWWCGQDKERDHVVANAGRMMIGPAHSTRLPFESDEMTSLGGSSRDDAGSLDEWMRASGQHLVGQEAVTLSTSPAYVDGHLVPRPMCLRVFLARTPDGWRVMPGGYARIGRTEDATAVAMQRGGSVADVWVVSGAPVEAATMVRPATVPFSRAEPGALPTRAAENLYWLGRYVERAEGIIRLIRGYHLRLAETADPEAPLLAHLSEYLGFFDIDPQESVPARLRATFDAALRSAGQVRDRFSVDGWMALNDLAETARRMSTTVTPGDDASRAMGVLLRKIAGFSGLVHENMYRFIGWRFMSIGRSLERADAMASALASFADPEAPDGGLDLAVEIGDSAMTHRRRHTVATGRATVIDLLTLDMFNPRSILYQVSEIRDHIGFLPAAAEYGQMAPLSRAVLKMHTSLAVETPDTLDTDALLELRGAIGELGDLLSQTYLK